MTKIWKKITAEKKINSFFFKNCNLPIPRPPQSMSKLQKKPSALKRGHPTLQNMNFYKFFSTFVGHFCPPGSGSGFRIRIWIPNPDLDSESGSGSTGPIESGSNPDPDPKPTVPVLFITVLILKPILISCFFTCGRWVSWPRWVIRRTAAEWRSRRRVVSPSPNYGAASARHSGHRPRVRVSNLILPFFMINFSLLRIRVPTYLPSFVMSKVR